MGKHGGITISLLDYLTWRMGCNCLSDLRFLTDSERNRLAWEIEKLSPDMVSLREWNEALEYLTGAKPRRTDAEARDALVSALTHMEA